MLSCTCRTGSSASNTINNSFQKDQNLKNDILLVVNSSLDPTEYDEVRDFLHQFLLQHEQCLLEGTDRIGIVQYSLRPVVEASPTYNMSILEEAIHNYVRDPSHLYPRTDRAIAKATEVLQQPPIRSHVNKHIVIITDGSNDDDTFSTSWSEDVANMAKKAGISLSVVATTGARDSPDSLHYLYRLASPGPVFLGPGRFYAPLILPLLSGHVHQQKQDLIVVGPDSYHSTIIQSTSIHPQPTKSIAHTTHPQTTQPTKNTIHTHHPTHAPTHSPTQTHHPSITHQPIHTQHPSSHTHLPTHHPTQTHPSSTHHPNHTLNPTHQPTQTHHPSVTHQPIHTQHPSSHTHIPTHHPTQTHHPSSTHPIHTLNPTHTLHPTHPASPYVTHQPIHTQHPTHPAHTSIPTHHPIQPHHPSSTHHPTQTNHPLSTHHPSQTHHPSSTHPTHSTTHPLHSTHQPISTHHPSHTNIPTHIHPTHTSTLQPERSIHTHSPIHTIQPSQHNHLNTHFPTHSPSSHPSSHTAPPTYVSKSIHQTQAPHEATIPPHKQLSSFTQPPVESTKKQAQHITRTANITNTNIITNIETTTVPTALPVSPPLPHTTVTTPPVIPQPPTSKSISTHHSPSTSHTTPPTHSNQEVEVEEEHKEPTTTQAPALHKTTDTTTEARSISLPTPPKTSKLVVPSTKKSNLNLNETPSQPQSIPQESPKSEASPVSSSTSAPVLTYPPKAGPQLVRWVLEPCQSEETPVNPTSSITTSPPSTASP